MTAPWRLSALELARAIARRELSCVDVIDAHLRRIREVNPSLDAIVHVLDDDARAAAREADRAVSRGDPLGPLHGVPVSVKSNIDVAGLPTTWGVVPLAHAIAPRDAPAVERLRAAGAIPIARTNMPDMALRVHTDSSLHGLTRNPWNAARTCGGSSGGEAVAIATGMSALGLGTDIGGSLRNPASACGIASLRPSLGRVPDAGLVPSGERLLAVQLMNVVGPLARRVADLRVALQVLSGAHPRDPQASDAPPEPARTAPIRVALVAEPPGGTTDPHVAAIVRRAGERLARAGYDVVEITPPRYADVVATWARLLLGDFAVALPELLPLMGDDARTFVERVSAAVPPLQSAADLSRLLVERDTLARAWSEFFADHPLILSPTWSQLPFELGFDVDTPEGTVATAELMRPVVPANLLGLPSACVPAARDARTGLPVGVLLTGARGSDMLCLDAAQAVERESGLQTPIDPVLDPAVA